MRIEKRSAVAYRLPLIVALAAYTLAITTLFTIQSYMVVTVLNLVGPWP